MATVTAFLGLLKQQLAGNELSAEERRAAFALVYEHDPYFRTKVRDATAEQEITITVIFDVKFTPEEARAIAKEMIDGA